MITKKWMEAQIVRLDELEASASVRVADAERVYRQANTELLAAQGELNALRTCKTELMIWRLANEGGEKL